MAYDIQGQMIEVCSCNVICPCWAGLAPDGGTCEGVVAYDIHRGTIDGLDVSGLRYAILLHIPGHASQGNWRIVIYIDSHATDRQQEAIVNALTGNLGGPLADIAQLFGEVAGVERAAILFEVDQSEGRLQIGSSIKADVEPLLGATGNPITMHDTVFTTVPGSPTFVGKALTLQVNIPQYGFSIDLRDHTSLQVEFRFAT